MIENIPGHEYCKQSTIRERPEKEDKSVDEHNYGSRKENMKVHEDNFASTSKKVNSLKDLKRDNEMIEKRFRAKIEESNGVLYCRACFAEFASKFSAC